MSMKCISAANAHEINVTSVHEKQSLLDVQRCNPRDFQGKPRKQEQEASGKALNTGKHRNTSKVNCKSPQEIY